MNDDSFALEMLKELKSQSKRWFIIAIIELVILIATNVGWFVYESQYETITDEQTITQEQIDTENSNMSGVIN